MINIIVIPSELVPIAFIYTIPIIIMPVYLISSIINSTVIIWTVILIKLRKMFRMTIIATSNSTRTTESVATITANIIIIIIHFTINAIIIIIRKKNDSNHIANRKNNAWNIFGATATKTALCIKNEYFTIMTPLINKENSINPKIISFTDTQSWSLLIPVFVTFGYFIQPKRTPVIK